MRIIKTIGSFVLLAFILACGWDWDTVKMEKQQFPQIHELITGKFYRHTPEVYYWRIKHRNHLLRQHPDSLQYYDDIAMAYDKIGEPAKAIEVMLNKEKKKPGLYETYANLGLFYMHNNEMKKGVLYVQKALKVNPNAHFGREKYQLHLGNYILSKQKDGELELPLSAGKTTGFYEYLRQHEFKSKDYKSDEHFAEVANAIKGVAGMMTFANYRSPVLLEVLADLLLHTRSARGAGHLASRAYLKASWETDSTASKAYYEKAKWAREYNYQDPRIFGEMDDRERKISGIVEKRDIVDSITGKGLATALFDMKQLETALKYEVQSAEIWFDSIRINELAWLKAGQNPDEEFDKKYYQRTELQNVEVDVYGTSAIARKVDNQKWLAGQLNKPQDIRNIHGFNPLPDSVKRVLDSIYASEFPPLPEQNGEMVCGTLNAHLQEEEEKTKASNAFWVYAGAGLGLALVLGIIWAWRRKRTG